MTMHTITTEIADGIFRISTGVEMPPKGFTFNQFLVKADEPLIFHTGPRQLFPLVSGAVGKIVPLDELRWITFGHVEADESGAMNLFLEAAPKAQVAHGALGCAVSLNDLADRPPRPLEDGEVMDLGGKRVRHIDTPHVPHNWESRVLYEETTRTLLCGDLFTSLGDDVPALSDDDPVGPALEAEEVFHASSLGPTTADTMRRLGDLEPKVLAVMHGPSYSGDGGASLRALADAYEKQYLTLA
jgi:flavorubredoxin